MGKEAEGAHARRAAPSRVPWRDLRLLIIGAGSIGTRHLVNAQALGVARIAVCDVDGGRRRSATGRGVETFPSLETALRAGGYDAALVCTPSAMHVRHARAAAGAGADLFLEKPLSHTATGVPQLLAFCHARGRRVMMGMCYRFHPGLARMRRLLKSGFIGRLYAAQFSAGHYLPDWHPWADYRQEYSARRDLGGGVLLDSIHSLDTVRWFFGEAAEVQSTVARLSDLEIDTEDLVACIICLKNGMVVELHEDYLQRAKRSRLVVIGSEGTLEWDGSRNSFRVYTASTAQWRRFRYRFAVNDMYRAELRYFLGCVVGGETPMPDGKDGWRTLQLALWVRSAKRQRSSEPVALLRTASRHARRGRQAV